MTLKLKDFAAGASLLALCAIAGAAQAQFIGSLASPSPAPAAPTPAPVPAAPAASSVLSTPIGPAQAPAAAAAQAPALIGSIAPTAAATRPILRVSVPAVVNDDPITSFDIQQRILWFVVTTGVTPSEQNIGQLQEEALDALIDEQLQTQELKKRARDRKMDENTLFVSDDEVNDYLDSIAGENRMDRNQFLGQLKARGLTETAIRNQLKVQLSWRDFIRRAYGSRIRVGDDQVRQATDRITAESSKPSYQISEIFLDAGRTGGIDNAVSSANQRMQQLQQGARFEALARQFSSLPTAAKGGDAGWMSSGEFRPEIESALTSMTAGQVRSVTTKDGVYLILLRDKKDGAAATTLYTLKQAAVPLPAGADQKTTEAATAKLTQVRAKATNCSNLDAAAQSAGLEADDLGEADVATLAPAFRTAVQTLQPGQITGPVRSAQGLHLLAVCGKRSAGADIPSKQEIQNRLMVEQLTMLQRRSLRDLRQSATINQPQ